MEQLKAYDTSQPRNGAIFFYAILSIVLLVLLKFALDSYFQSMMDAEYHEKVAIRGLEPVREMRENEAAALEKAGMDRAMQALSQRGRAVSPLIKPDDGAGKPPVEGWTQLRPPAPPAAAGAEPAAAGAEPGAAEGAAAGEGDAAEGAAAEGTEGDAEAAAAGEGAEAH